MKDAETVITMTSSVDIRMSEHDKGRQNTRQYSILSEIVIMDITIKGVAVKRCFCGSCISKECPNFANTFSCNGRLIR